MKRPPIKNKQKNPIIKLGIRCRCGKIARRYFLGEPLCHTCEPNYDDPLDKHSKSFRIVAKHPKDREGSLTPSRKKMKGGRE